MKLLLRDVKEFEYLPYDGLETDLDENNLHTGIFRPDYGDPVRYRGNISAPSGSATQAFDGLEIRYSHVLLMDDPKADIRETGKIRCDGRLYGITAVRPSVNVLSVALIEETVDYGDQTVNEPEEEPVQETEGDNDGDT